MFPLELVVFPGETVPLHIFEPRYKQLIGECRDEGITFGIPPVIDGQPARYGTELALTKVLRTYDTGEMDILTEGRHIFHLQQYHVEIPDKLYSGAEIERLENDSETDTATRETIIHLYHDLQKLVKSDRRIDPDRPEILSWAIGHHVGLETIDKVKLLSLTSENDRLKFLGDHLATTVPKLAETLKTRGKIGGNGHIKDFRHPN